MKLNLLIFRRGRIASGYPGGWGGHLRRGREKEGYPNGGWNPAFLRHVQGSGHVGVCGNLVDGGLKDAVKFSVINMRTSADANQPREGLQGSRATFPESNRSNPQCQWSASKRIRRFGNIEQYTIGRKRSCPSAGGGETCRSDADLVRYGRERKRDNSRY